MKRKERGTLYNTKRDELLKLSIEIERKLTILTVDRHTKPSKNTRERKNLRQKLAIIKTYIHAKELTHD